jgi:hypothetical protein
MHPSNTLEWLILVLTNTSYGGVGGGDQHILEKFINLGTAYHSLRSFDYLMLPAIYHKNLMAVSTRGA